MLDSHNTVNVYEGNRETETFTGMIFPLTLEEIKKFNWELDKYFYNIEGTDYYKKEDIDVLIKKLETAHHG